MSPEIATALRAANIGLAALLWFILSRRGIAGVRCFFAAYLLFHAARGAVLLAIPINRTWYGHIYFATEPVVWILYVLTVVELYSGALRSYAGIMALSRWVLGVVVAFAVIASILSLAPDLGSPHPFPVIKFFTAIGRAICTSLALFLLGTTLFFLAYPIPLSRNTLVHTAICALYFLTHAAAYFVHNVVGPSSWALVNLALVLMTSTSLLAWLFFLKPEGEQVIVRHRPQWSPEAEEQMLARLNALNGMLLRSIRK